MSMLAGMSPELLALIAGGSAASGIGSLLGGSASARAGRQARDFGDGRTGAQQLLVGSEYFGPEYADLIQTSQLLQIARQRQDLPEIRRLTDQLNSHITNMGGPIRDQQQRLADTVSARQTGNLGYFDQETAGLNADEAAALSAYDQEAAGVNNLAAGEEDMARGWGQSLSSLINQDYDTALRAADDTATATLAASGFGNSTARTSALRENRVTNRRERSRALQDAQNASIDRQLSARRARTGTANGILNTRAGFRTDRIGRQYSRSGQRLALEERNLGRDIALHGEPINSSISMNQSSVLNPWLGANTSQYYPASTGLASALSEIGGAAAGLGAYGVGEQSALARIRAMQGTTPR